MRAAILSLVGIAPTAVLGASYLATNTSQFIGVWIPDDAPTPVLVGNGTSIQDRAATIQTKDGILEFERPVNGTAHTWQTVVNGASGSLGFATKNNGITPTPGFSFAKDGTLVFKNDPTNHGFRGCHSAGSTYPTIIMWQSVHEPLGEYCYHLTLKKVDV
jgi:PPE-repeat protein